WAIIFAGIAGLPSVALAVGIGTLIGGVPGLDAGRDYVPIAAVFVFLVGGGEVDEFTFGFAVQLALGIGLGVLVNFAVPPPLRTATAKQSIRELRARL